MWSKWHEVYLWLEWTLFFLSWMKNASENSIVMLRLRFAYMMRSFRLSSHSISDANKRENFYGEYLWLLSLFRIFLINSILLFLYMSAAVAFFLWVRITPNRKASPRWKDTLPSSIRIKRTRPSMAARRRRRRQQRCSSRRWEWRWATASVWRIRISWWVATVVASEAAVEVADCPSTRRAIRDRTARRQQFQ